MLSSLRACACLFAHGRPTAQWLPLFSYLLAQGQHELRHIILQIQQQQQLQQQQMQQHHQHMQQQQQEVQLQLQEMRTQLAQKGVDVGDSATTLGENVLRVASREQLVTVTAAAHETAEQWLERAGADGERVRQASQPGSRLPEAGEEGVHQLFRSLLDAQPPGPLVVHDVHKTTSVCRSLKPDVVVTIGPHRMIPSSAVGCVMSDEE